MTSVIVVCRSEELASQISVHDVSIKVPHVQVIVYCQSLYRMSSVVI
jgi:hypothetical protein